VQAEAAELEALGGARPAALRHFRHRERHIDVAGLPTTAACSAGRTDRPTD